QAGGSFGSFKMFWRSSAPIEACDHIWGGVTCSWSFAVRSEQVVLPQSADHMRKRALSCRRAAETTPSGESRRFYLDVANAWERTAAQFDEHYGILICSPHAPLARWSRATLTRAPHSAQTTG